MEALTEAAAGNNQVPNLQNALSLIALAQVTIEAADEVIARAGA